MGLPNEIHPFHLAGAGQGYQVANSLRFRASNTAYMSRLFGTPTSSTTWTWSGWVKKTQIGSTYTILGASVGAGVYFMADFSGDQLDIFQYNGGFQTRVTSNAVYRDPSAWYHVMFVWDTTQATSTITGSSTDRVRLYINGAQVTSLSGTTAPSQNLACYWNDGARTNVIGYRNYNNDLYFDGYMTEINFIDGQALTPSSFGQTDSITGIWGPKKYTGTYGNNGFYLPFNDATSTTTLGYDRQLGMSDSSKNNWTLNNISVTSGVTYDVMRDSPTGYDDGSNVYNRSNYCVMNPLISQISGVNISATLSNANLTATDANNPSYNSGSNGTIGFSSGKWYWEAVVGSSGPTYTVTGLAFLNPYQLNYSGIEYAPYNSSGTIRWASGGSSTNLQTSVGSVSAGDVIGLVVDADNKTIAWYKNNVQVGTTVTYTSYLPAASYAVWPSCWFANGTGASLSFNFGQRPFSYTPPAGFKALNSFNLPNPSLPLV